MRSGCAMRLRELIDNLDARLVGDADPPIARVTDDSRDVRPAGSDGGTLFVARAGTRTSGERFLHDAISRGAVAVLREDDALGLPAGVADLRCDEAAWMLAHLAERINGNPSSRLFVIGVTGTNGKSTTAHLVHRVLNSIGVPCGLIGTIEVDEGNGPHEARLTTPPAHELSASLARTLDHGCNAVVLEASSHALDQRRVEAIAFDVAIFTNLSGDHLDYHADMDEYASAKAHLFELLSPSGLAVVNADDPAHTRMIRDCQAVIRRVGADADNCLSGIDVSLEGTRFKLGDAACTTPLIGAHNAMNAAQALIACEAVCAHVGADASTLAHALAMVGVPRGRFERVDQGAASPAVFVDYAHTDDALAHACATLASIVPPGGELIVVFGCGGDRDRTKRPRMARAVAAHADRIIITSDNPRTEDPETIIDEVIAGVPEGLRYERSADRRSAIHLAIRSATPRDVVLIAGKGHETYQLLPDSNAPDGVRRIDFDDRVVACDALAARHAETGASA
ncbi:MAG: UDP-N-acetylmuramoyl-L-alanyl-D-glutamate--2,6-diaminopimelate ligase [Planctomycetota bacterium]